MSNIAGLAFGMMPKDDGPKQDNDPFSPTYGSRGWELDQEKRQAQQAQADAEELAAFRAANQPAPQPQDEIDAIIEKHKQAALQEIQQRRQLTKDQREAETLNTAVGSLSLRIEQMIQTGADFSKVTELQKELDAKTARLRELTNEPSSSEITAGKRWLNAG